MNGETYEEGGCLCGGVRYRITGAIGSACHCHCTMCQRSSGAVVVTWVSVPTERFAITHGEPAVYRSSAHAERRFCRNCGAQLTFRSEESPDEIDVTLGTLDHPENYPADRHIWTTSRLPWLRLDEHLPGRSTSTREDAES